MFTAGAGIGSCEVVESVAAEAMLVVLLMFKLL